MIRNVSFGGFYMIKFPKTTPDSKIKATRELMDNHIKENNYLYMDTLLRENIQPQNPEQSTTDILFLPNIDNSSQIYDTLSVVSPKLAEQYLDKTKVYLNLDTVA